MEDSKQDKQLQAPQEANTEKHINFREVDETDNTSGSSNDTSTEADDSPTKKAWKELREDNKKDNGE